MYLINNFEQISVKKTFVAVFGKLGGKILVVDNFFSSDEKWFHPTASFDENCIECEVQRDRNYYVDLRESHFALKLKFVKKRG